MVLSDATIARQLAERRIEIDPYDEALLQPSSVDVRVDRFFRVFHNNRYPFIDVKVEQAELTELVEVDDEHPFVLHPGEFVLGSTLERIRLPDDLVARLEGKSSLGRLGLLIHSTAGFIDPGRDGSGLSERRLRGSGRGRPPRRDHQGPAGGVRARDGGGDAERRRGGEGGGRTPLRARERARPRRAVEGRRAVLRREVGDGEGSPRVGARARDLP